MYIRIGDQQALDAFIEGADHFHDSLLKEASLIYRGYVDRERSMHGDISVYDARLCFQQQSASTPCIDMLLESITEFNLGSGLIADCIAELTGDGIRIELSNGTIISAKVARYCFRGEERLGEELFFSAGIPNGELKTAILLEDRWIQCPECANAWEAAAGRDYELCPSCKTWWTNPLCN